MTGLPRLVAYCRTSTIDQQSPEDSKSWQLARIRDVTAGRAEVIRVVHDTDTTRAIPWERREQAARLLRELAGAERDWDGIVVGETARAFGNAMQAQLVLLQLEHFGAQLWAPEVGGPVDADSEAHDILLNLFGGLSKAERQRLKIRVRTAMRQMATTGRWLGGRPPYGYRLVPTGLAHPNPELARYGVELHRLEPDPATAAVVVWIFEMRAEGHGWRSIATHLDLDAIPCPSAVDRARNPHRLGRAWSIGAVRAIVINPRYKGTATFGRYHKVEKLYDPTDPAAGHVTRMSPADPDSWVVAEGAVPAIVTPGLWAAAQPTPTRQAKTGPRPDRPGPNRYALRGMLCCGLCNRTMQGNVVTRAKGAASVHYRCVYRTHYPADDGHPRSLAVAEHRVLAALDGWLGAIFDPDHLDSTVEAILAADHRTTAEAEPLAVTQARSAARDAEERIQRHLAALDAGLDPALVVERTKEAQADLVRARAVLAEHEATATRPALTADAVRAVIERYQGLAGLLDAAATPEERWTLYSGLGLGLGLNLTYHRRPDAPTPRRRVRHRGAGAWSIAACRRGDPYSTPTLVLRTELALAG